MPAFWENTAKNRFGDLQVYSNLSSCNCRVFVKETLLEINFIEISFISSVWPVTRPYFLLNFGSENIGLRTIKLANTLHCATQKKT